MRQTSNSGTRTVHFPFISLLFLAFLIALTSWGTLSGYTANRQASLTQPTNVKNSNPVEQPSSEVIAFDNLLIPSPMRASFDQLVSKNQLLPTSALPSHFSLWQVQDNKISEDGLWQEIKETSSMRSQTERSIVPRSYRTLHLNKEVLTELLSKTPTEFTEGAKNNRVVMILPMPDGTFARFSIKESSIMEPELAAKFPEIKTYQGQGIDDPSATMRFDWTPAGFHAVILTEHGTTNVDPYSSSNKGDYISYYRRDYSTDFNCSVSEKNNSAEKSQSLIVPNISSGETLHTYRLAVAATGEYTRFTGGTVSTALQLIVSTINRVNAIYEREAAVRLILISREDEIIFTSTNDGYNNNNPFEMAKQNQEHLDRIIGNSGYDIGHVFGTDIDSRGNGNSPGSACDFGTKGEGASSRREPLGEPFADIVAHEIGHQFGAKHTFNGTQGLCAIGAREAQSAYEPGSGSTIMSYGFADWCSSQTLQTDKDNYFHAKSLEQIINYVNGHGCGGRIATGNRAPMVTVTAPIRGNYIIPIFTPFTLTASGTDPDGDSVTYCWEEFDLGAPSPPDTDIDGNPRPIFRSFVPTSNPSRTFPKLADILNNTSTFGEYRPYITRTMNFRVTVRDNRVGGGGTNASTLPVEVTASAGPFVVTQPNLATTWTAASSQVVKWDPANTANAPVSCPTVKILLSIDGGNSFPYILSSGTPNDGEHTITVPNFTSRIETARVKVEAVGNIFFDISYPNFPIVPGSGGGGNDTIKPTVTINSPTSNSTYSTSGSTLTLRGIATDNAGVTQVTCTNDRGSNCSASGTTNWTAYVTGLQNGANVIRVSARDAAGNIGTKSLTVTYTPLPVCGNGTSESYRVNGNPPLHPNGTLIKTRSSQTIYVLQSGQRRGIPSPTILNNLYQNGGFDFKDVITIADDEFSLYPEGAVVNSTLPSNGRSRPDGRLIKRVGGSEISIVTNSGRRRPFTSESAFLGLGYLYCNVVEASDYDSYPADPPADASTVLTISSIEPSSMQTRDWGSSITYTFTVRDTLGNPVTGAAVGGQDNLRGTGLFIATYSTDSNGQGTYTTTVPNGTRDGLYDILFIAEKTGYTTSDAATRQVQVSHTPSTLTITNAEPSALQMRDWNESVNYIVTVKDENGSPVSGATIVGEDNLRRTIFTTSPRTTDSNGQITFSTTIPNGATNRIYNIRFIAQKDSHMESSSVTRQIQVNHIEEGIPPTIRITSPTVGTTYNTNINQITLAGTASDNIGVTIVTWMNDRGGSGITSGTTNWMADSISLQSGTNILTVAAQDAAGNIGTATLTVIYTSTGADITGPTLSITSPIDGQTVTTNSITVSGTATDAGTGDNGVSSVTVNGVRASGDTASDTGTAHWSRTISLNQGANTITVVASDNSPNHNPTTWSITITLQGTSCSYSLTPLSQNLPAGGGNGRISVKTTQGCSWTARSNVDWITVQSASNNSGSGTVNYAVTANYDTAPRTGTMNVAGKTFSVNQASELPPSLISISPNHKTAGGAGFVLTVYGLNFEVGSKVQWNYEERVTRFINSQKLQANIPASDIALAGAHVSVNVLNPSLGLVSNALKFELPTSSSFIVTKIDYSSNRLPGKFPTSFPRERTGEAVTQNYNAFTNDDRYQATRVFTTSRTLADVYSFYLNYLNNNGWTIDVTWNQPDSKGVAASQGGGIGEGGNSVQINADRNSITGIRSVGIYFSYLTKCVPRPPGMVGLWSASNNASDSIGTNNGTFIGHATASGIGPAGFGKAFELNGVDSYVSIPDAVSQRPANLTVEAWVKFNSLESYSRIPGLQYLVFKRNTRTQQFEGYSLQKVRVNGKDVLEFVISSTDGQQARATGKTLLVTDQFYHVVGTYDRSSLKLYVNGVLEAQVPSTLPLSYGSKPLFIGSSGEPQILDGLLSGVIDEVTLYNRALSASEIHAIFEAGGSGKCKPCTYSISPKSQSISAAGGSGTVNVTTDSSCAWKASSNASFITITSGGNSTGNGPVNYSVSANNSTRSRTGTMTVAGQTFTLTQAPPTYYSISGRITLAGTTTGLGGVIVKVTSPSPAGFTPRTFTTTSTGNFSFINLPKGRTYKVLPAKLGYAFTPASRSYTNLSSNQVSQNFSGTLRTFIISGRVVGADGVALSSVTMKLTGSRTASTTTLSDGSYKFTSIPAGGNYTVSPIKSGFIFNPVNRSLTNLSASVVASFNGAPASCNFGITPSNADFNATGGDGYGVVNVLGNSLCKWIAKSNVSWIKITSGASGTGNGTVSYTAISDHVTAPRTGTMTIAGKTFTVTQHLTTRP